MISGAVKDWMHVHPHCHPEHTNTHKMLLPRVRKHYAGGKWWLFSFQNVHLFLSHSLLSSPVWKMLGLSLCFAHKLKVAPLNLYWFGFLKETLHHWTPEKLAEGNNGALEFLLLILHVMISRLNTILLLAHASQSWFSLTHASEYGARGNSPYFKTPVLLTASWWSFWGEGWKKEG